MTEKFDSEFSTAGEKSRTSEFGWPSSLSKRNKHTKNPDGDVVMSFKVTQSGVDEKFRMLVSIYLEFNDGHTTFLGRARMSGKSSVESKVPLKGLKEFPRQVLINYNDDVLASAN